MEEPASSIPQNPIKSGLKPDIASSAPTSPITTQQLPVPKKRLIILLVIFLILLVAAPTGFVYLEKQNRELLRMQFEADQLKFASPSPYLNYIVSSPTPFVSASIILASPNLTSPGMQFLAEDDSYQIFINVIGGTIELEGSLKIVNKSTGEEIFIDDNFVIFGSASVNHSPDNNYLWINTGTYITRGIQLVSLPEKRKIAEFCSTHGKLFFYEYYVVYADCFDDIPAWIDVTPNIVATDLKTNNITTIFQATETEAYFLKEMNETVIKAEVVFKDGGYENRFYDLKNLPQ